MLTTNVRPMPEVIVHQDIYFDAWFNVIINSKGYWVKDDGVGLQFAPEGDRFKKVYSVRVVAGHGAGCSCPDSVYRKRLCKHALAAKTIIDQTW